jgi:hypothetical protein
MYLPQVLAYYRCWYPASLFFPWPAALPCLILQLTGLLNKVERNKFCKFDTSNNNKRHY